MSNDLSHPYTLSTTLKGAYLFGATFQTNGESDPDGVTPATTGVTFERSDVGEYTLTFDAPPSELLWADAQVLGDEPRLHAKVVSYSAASGVLTVKVYQEADNDDTADWSSGIAVTDDAATLGAAGFVAEVIATAGSTVGPCTVLETGTPSTTQCTVTYADGVPTLTFAAADAVTECSALVISDSTSGAADSTDKSIQVIALFYGVS